MEEKREIEENQKNQLSLLETAYTLIDFTKYPIFVRSSTKDKRKQYTYKIDEGDWNITLTISNQIRLPGLEEKKIYIWLMCRIKEYFEKIGKIPEKIPYTIYEIRKFWGEKREGKKSYLDIWNALETLSRTHIKLVVKPLNFDSAIKEHIDEFFIIERVSKTQIDKETEKREKGEIALTLTFQNILSRKRLRPQCLQLWKEGIESGSVALSNLEELLEYYHACTGHNVISFSYNDLTTKLGLQKYNSLSEIKRQLGFIEKKGKEIGIIKRMEIREIIEQGEEKKGKIFRVEFEIREKIKQAVANHKINSNHKKLLDTSIQEKTIEDENKQKIEDDLPFWIKEFKERLGGVGDEIEEIQNLMRKIMQDHKNYEEIFYQTLSETKLYNPKNKIAYILNLLLAKSKKV